MRDQQRLPVSSETRREELFTQRYAQLRSWALRLTNQDRESAEDLVQDAFIQFALGRTSLEEIENIDGYLRRMLRYMYLSKMNRNSQKFFDQTLSISEYDSFHQTWRTIEPPERMQAQEELCQICTYACLRKETSRAGSVLILRFFHDYYPTEIAKVLCSSRHCVDQWQRLARSELKLYLTKPARLRFVNAKAKTQIKKPLTKLSAVDCDVIGELRQMIFRSRQGECLNTEELREIYQQPNPEALTTVKLAHIVSCARCLDLVNQLTGLPSLAERYQSDAQGPKDPPAGPISGGDAHFSYQGRLREVREHKPKELRIAVNGLVLGSLKISSERSELDLNLGQPGVDFIEVNSEQGVQLLFLSVSDAARSKSQHWARIELSEGRVLEAVLSFEADPTLHLTYLDPEVVTAPTAALLHVVENRSETVDAGASNTRTMARTLLHSFWRWTSPTPRISIWTRPEFITAVVSLLVIGAFLALKIWNSTDSTATSLLGRASVAEKLSRQAIDKVTHRVVTLEQRSAAGERVVQRQRIETWETAGARTQKLYDDRGTLIAAIWERQDGSTTIYHHGSKLQNHAVTEVNKLTPQDIWQFEFSAAGFKGLVSDTDGAHVQATPTAYVVTYKQEMAFGTIRVLKVSLSLNRSSLHPIEQILLVARDNEVWEYRFVETNYERIPQNSVNPRVFEVDPELTDEEHRIEVTRSSTTTSVTPPNSLPHPTKVASTELEVDVAYLLDQANGDRNEQLALSRTNEGILKVEGVVESEQRKLEILRILEPVSNNPAVKITIRSVQETIQQTKPWSGSVVVREADETANTIAVYSELHSYFTRSAAEDQLDETVRAFSSKAVNRAYRILFHAIELKRLAHRFGNIDMRTVTSDARSKWRRMTSEHASVVEREMALLRQDLEPIFFSSSINVEESEITNDVELAHAIERLHKLTAANNQAIRDAFTISSRSSSTAIKSVQFWRSMRSSEQLARLIRKHQSLPL